MVTQEARFEELLQINHATIEAMLQAQREAKQAQEGVHSDTPANNLSFPFQQCLID
ncbi:hypothetical protein GCM10027085_43080 [Spirosoma aerophilum]